MSQQDQTPYVPTPEEIRRKCEEFQSRWSEEERQIRAGLWPEDQHNAAEDEELG